MRTVLYFHSKSALKSPGKGANEVIDANRIREFVNLQEIDPNWRKVLSNFYEGDFVYNGSCYRTAEHAFQAAKIAIVSREKAREFTKESGSPLGMGDGNTARKSRKVVMLNEDELCEWNKIKNQVMKGILSAKFSQVEHAKQVLLATLDAELWHGTRGLPKSRQNILEQIRANLQHNVSVRTENEVENEIPRVAKKARR